MGSEMCIRDRYQPKLSPSDTFAPHNFHQSSPPSSRTSPIPSSRRGPSSRAGSRSRGRWPGRPLCIALPAASSSASHHRRLAFMIGAASPGIEARPSICAAPQRLSRCVRAKAGRAVVLVRSETSVRLHVGMRPAFVLVCLDTLRSRGPSVSAAHSSHHGSAAQRLRCLTTSKSRRSNARESTLAPEPLDLSLIHI